MATEPQRAGEPLQVANALQVAVSGVCFKVALEAEPCNDFSSKRRTRRRIFLNPLRHQRPVSMPDIRW